MRGEDEDLESYWASLRPASAIKVVSGKISNLREGLELAALKAEQMLLKQVDDSAHRFLTMSMSELVSVCANSLLAHWYEGLRGHGPGSLLEIVLADQHLPVGELKDFVRALPVSLIERVLKSHPLDKASGLHALIAIELHFRRGSGNDYTIRRGSDGVLKVTLHPTNTSKSVVFSLDENFTLGG